VNFSSPWILWFLMLPIAWAVWEWRRTYRVAGILLKSLVFLLVILALAEPRLTTFESKMAVGVLADSSPSIPDEQIEQARETIQRIAGLRENNQVRVFSFDGETRPGLPSTERSPALAAGTNLEQALRAGMAALPPERVPKLLLISDGLENQGSIERVIHQVQQRGIAVSSIELEGRKRPELRLRSLSVPSQAFSGERFTISLTLESPRATQAEVALTVEEKSIGRSQVSLAPGENTVRVKARLDAAGSALISGTVSAGDLGEVHFEHTMALARPRALLVSSDPRARETHLLGVLSAAGFEVERTTGSLHPKLEEFDLVIANNFHLEGWPEQRKERAAEFIRDGGGFLLIAGENSLYIDHEDDDRDALRDALPAELAPPRTPEGTAVVLILDKSSSMEGKKMELARQSAMGVVENLRPIDQVGVLVFDNSFQWTVPLRNNDDPEGTKELISSIIADGGTQIAPALNEAFRHIRPAKAAYRHMLLLTDGISEEGDSIALARQAAKAKVTISTIGLGQDVNRAYLERVARTAEGEPHFLLDISALTQLVLRDVMEHTGSSVMEKDIRPEVVKQVEILDDVSLEDAGPLLGWVKFVAKPEAETILRADEEDPLLVRWQYGLGRAAVFTSDAKELWAGNWVEWAGFDTFWANVMRDLLPRSPRTEASARYDSAEGEIVVEYRWQADAHSDPPEPLPELYVLGPAEFQEVVPLEQQATGSYEARVATGEHYGLFRIRPASALEHFPEVAFYRENAELNEYGSNPALLRKIADWTGGQFNPEPEEIFVGGQAIPSSMNLWPGLLALAVLFNLIELFARKGWIPWLRRWA